MKIGNKVKVESLGVIGIYLGLRNKTVIVQCENFIIKTHGDNITNQPNK